MTVTVEVDAYTDKNLEEMVDDDIITFDRFFQGLGNDPLSPFEKAAIKTYLFYKTHGESNVRLMSEPPRALDGESTDQQTQIYGDTHGEQDGT